MSGKAPPTGPRALLGTYRPTSPINSPSSSSPALSQHRTGQAQHPPRSQTNVPSTPTGSRIGAPPPTGPRSLTNGIQNARQPPPAPKSLLNGHTTTIPHISTPNVVNNVSSIPPHERLKGKRPESPTTSWPSPPGRPQPPQSNGITDQPPHPPAPSQTLPSASVLGGGRAAISIPMAQSARPGALARDKPTISIPLQPRALSGPAPPTEPPPPPPPPSYDPPPPPPPPSDNFFHQPPPPSDNFFHQPPPPSEPPPPPPPPPSLAAPPLPPAPPPPATAAPPLPPAPPGGHAAPSSLPPPLPSSMSLPPPPPPSLAPPPPPNSPPSSPLIPPALSPSPPPTPLDRDEPTILIPNRPAPPSSHLRFQQPSDSLSLKSFATNNIHPVESDTTKIEPVSLHQPAREATPEPPKLYSLPPLPDWPPPRSEYPSIKSYKLLYDPAVDTSSNITILNPHPPSYYRALIEHIRVHASPAVRQERIRGKGPGKEQLFRFEGEITAPTESSGVGEDEIVPKDPRREKGFKRMPSHKTGRSEFYEVKYEYDVNSTGPPPPAAVLITNISPLTPNQQIRRHFSTHGTIMSFEPQIDKENGSALGIVYIKFQTHDEAKRCVERENGKKNSVLGVFPGAKMENEELRVVFDGEGVKLKAVLKELEERKKRERDEKKRRESGKVQPPVNGILPTSLNSVTSQSAAGKLTPQQVSASSSTTNAAAWKPNAAQLPPRPPTTVIGITPGRPQASSAIAPIVAPVAGLPLRPLHPSLPPNPHLAAATQNHHSSESPQPGTTSSTSNAAAPRPPSPRSAAQSSQQGQGVAGQHPPSQSHVHPLPPPPPRTRAPPPPSLVKARMSASMPLRPLSASRESDSSAPTPMHNAHSSRGGRYGTSFSGGYDYRSTYYSRVKDGRYPYQPSPLASDNDREGRESRLNGLMRSRSPSPQPLPKPGLYGAGMSGRYHGSDGVMDKDEIMEELHKNGMDHIKMTGLNGVVKAEEVKAYFSDFPVDKVLRGMGTWFVTFNSASSARRASMVLGSSTAKLLAYQTPVINVVPPPPKPIISGPPSHYKPQPPRAPSTALYGSPAGPSSSSSSTSYQPSYAYLTQGVWKNKVWGEKEMVDKAQDLLMKEFVYVLQRDVMERVVGPEIRRLVADESWRSATASGAKDAISTSIIDGEISTNAIATAVASAASAVPSTTGAATAARGLKGLSFKKQRRPAPSPPPVVHEEQQKEVKAKQYREDRERRKGGLEKEKKGKRTVLSDDEAEQEEVDEEEPEGEADAEIEVEGEMDVGEEDEEDEEPVIGEEEEVDVDEVEGEEEEHGTTTTQARARARAGGAESEGEQEPEAELEADETEAETEVSFEIIPPPTRTDRQRREQFSTSRQHIFIKEMERGEEEEEKDIELPQRKEEEEDEVQDEEPPEEPTDIRSKKRRRKGYVNRKTRRKAVVDVESEDEIQIQDAFVESEEEDLEDKIKAAIVLEKAGVSVPSPVVSSTTITTATSTTLAASSPSPSPAQASTPTGAKRSASEDREQEEEVKKQPAKKKQKLEGDEPVTKVKKVAKSKKSAGGKRGAKGAVQAEAEPELEPEPEVDGEGAAGDEQDVEIGLQVPPAGMHLPPFITDVLPLDDHHVQSQTSSRSSSPELLAALVGGVGRRTIASATTPAAVRAATPPPTPTPLPDPVALGLCQDDEDLYLLRLALSGYDPSDALDLEDEFVGTSATRGPWSSTTAVPQFDSLMLRKHTTGSARSEGYYKISHAEKAAYVAQYQARSTGADRSSNQNNIMGNDNNESGQHTTITSSRSNRANARRRAQGLEEINQVQRAVALSKGETTNELNFKFNQLQTRKKHLRFARSPIHDWGLYAMEKISKGEMVIEYVGEVIRAQVADKREKTYERQGIGSSYLFRIDEDLVVDATKKGNLGRLINHSCDPNCTAKIITINGEKKIVIYAKQDIELGDEITYDYHFPFEQDKIPCLCGSAKCRGFLN